MWCSSYWWEFTTQYSCILSARQYSAVCFRWYGKLLIVWVLGNVEVISTVEMFQNPGLWENSSKQIRFWQTCGKWELQWYIRSENTKSLLSTVFTLFLENKLKKILQLSEKTKFRSIIVKPDTRFFFIERSKVRLLSYAVEKHVFLKCLIIGCY